MSLEGKGKASRARRSAERKIGMLKELQRQTEKKQGKKEVKTFPELSDI